jgi:outer membrane protein
MKNIITGILILFTASWSFSQDNIWTLEKCIHHALEKNISINQKILNNELSEITLDQSKADLLPNLSASGSQSWNFGRSVDPYTNDYVSTNVGSNNFSLSSQVTLFDGLQNVNTIKKNQLDVQSGNLDLEKTKNDITLSVTQAYLQVLFAYEQVENSILRLESTAAQVERTQKLVNAGSSPEGDLFKINSQLASDQYSFVNAENQLSISKVNLMQIMELPVEEKFDIVIPDFDVTTIGITTPGTSDEIFSKALEVQPEIESSELKVASAEQSLKIAKGGLYPRLSLSGSLGTGYSNARTLRQFGDPVTDIQEIGYLQSDPTELVVSERTYSPSSEIDYAFGDQIRDNLSESVRLSLSIPIFNRFQVKNNISRSRINVETAELNKQNTENQLRKTIEQAYNDLISSAKNYDAAVEQLKSLERSYNDTERKYELGMVNATDYLIEKNNYENSKFSLSRAKYEYIFTYKILEFYQGIPITF